MICSSFDYLYILYLSKYRARALVNAAGRSPSLVAIPDIHLQHCSYIVSGSAGSSPLPDLSDPTSADSPNPQAFVSHCLWQIVSTETWCRRRDGTDEHTSITLTYLIHFLLCLSIFQSFSDLHNLHKKLRIIHLVFFSDGDTFLF